ncbi:hypothetical protein JCM11251_004314 [Rhodosporidiobolus azoricus]
MDALDGNLHSSLLAALAANLASSPAQDESLPLLASPSEAIGSGHGGQGFNGDATGAEADADAETLTNDQVESIIAFASYAAEAPALAAEAAVEQVLSLLSQSTGWEIEVAIGAQAGQPCPPSSRLTCALASAALALASSVASSRSYALKVLFSTHSTLIDQLKTASPSRIIAYLLPALEGLTRALSETTLSFTADDAAPSFSTSIPDTVTAAFLLPWSPETEDGRAVLATLDLYRSSPSTSATSVEQAAGISPSTPLLSHIVLQEAYWSSRLSCSSSLSIADRWSALVKGTVKPDIKASAEAQAVAQETLKLWEAMVEKVEQVEKARQEEGEDGVDISEAIEVEQSGDVLVRSLRLAALASIAAHKLPADLLPTLESLLHPTSLSIDPSLQVIALQSLQLLGSSPSFTENRSSSLETLKRFILSAALKSDDDPAEASPVAIAVVRAYAALVSASETPSQTRTSAVQALISFVAAAERQGYDGLGGQEAEEKEVAAANAVIVVAGLTKDAGEVQLIRLALSTIQHHLITTASPIVLSACLASLVSLAPYAPDGPTFRDLLRSICTAASSTVSSMPSHHADDNDPEGDDQRYASVLTALSKLAEVAAKKKEVKDVGEGFLMEVLGLFSHKATVMRSKKVSTEQRSSTLLALVPVLSTYLTATSFSPSTTISSSLSALFRSFWYTCLLNGFLTPGRSGAWSRLSEWQQDALNSAALRSPPLVAAVGDEMVEMFAALGNIIKGGEPPMSVEAIRGDLSSDVPSQSSAARSLPATQAVFLCTVLRLESLRAQAGALAPFFTYLGVRGLSSEKEPALAETLKSVGDKVLSIYLTQLSQQVTSHALDRVAYKQVREVLLCTTHRSQQVRETALRYLDNLLSSFPSLVCDLGVVTVMLELLTVLRRACVAEFTDEYTPTYSFSSTRGDFTLTLGDDYPTRNRILRSLHQSIRAWLLAGITRSPLEMHGLLQEYIDVAADGYKMQMTVFADDEMGKSVALELVKTPPSNGKYAALPAWGNWNADAASSFSRTFAAKSFFGGEAQRNAVKVAVVLEELDKLADQLDHHKLPYKLPELRDLFYRAAALIVKAAHPNFAVLHHVVNLPIRLFTEASVAVGQEVWTWVADARPELEPRVVAEVLEAWTGAIEKEQGLFNRALDPENPLNQETQYNPTDKDALSREYLLANRAFSPMLALLDFLSSRFQAFRYRNADLVYASMRLVDRCLEVNEHWSHHPLSRELRFRIISFGFCILQGSRFESATEFNFRTKLYDAILQWFSGTPRWSFGSNRIQLKSDLQAIDEVLVVVSSDSAAIDHLTSTSEDRSSSLPGRIAVSAARDHHRLRQQLVKVLLNDEVDRLRLWINPLQDSKRGPLMSGEIPPVEELKKLARFAWVRWPKVAVFLPDRFKAPLLAQEIARLVRGDPTAVQDCPDALAWFVDDGLTAEAKAKLRHLLFWAPTTVPSALRFLHPKFGNDPVLLQYALGVLEHHPVEVTFFYIPQVVQALRTDDRGYAERFIFETSKISQLFCHQIIWNMKANAYRGDNAEEPDPMKPTLDRMVDMIVESLSGDAKDFYQREFAFFDEVTSISGKLKPYIKASKPEKKAKIDEEMAKIKVDPGVYLPSNPDGVLVDINRKSGRPLQSHAKAPFMATFKVRRVRNKVDTDDLEAQDVLIDVKGAENTLKEEYDTWQSAIFKVGDDCRQDVLALQIIAIHKNIFNSLGLDLLVTPYRVTATGPGCGVIDVVPNATSRDEMGRAKINDLQSFFVMKYGSPESVEFQRARTNFVQSMAAYSLLCYIIQIKDRHNGNIMVDGHGRITHIDFGFLFDIDESFQIPDIAEPRTNLLLCALFRCYAQAYAILLGSPPPLPLALVTMLISLPPQGVKFEPNSFKLSHEMVVLMGGRDSVGFRQFRELTVKAFLAARYYAQAFVDTTSLMLAAEFPSFKGEGTIDRLKGRFRLDLCEKDAAKFMVDIINDACENKRSIVYDEFQRVTNGIPYTR